MQHTSTAVADSCISVIQKCTNWASSTASNLRWHICNISFDKLSYISRSTEWARRHLLMLRFFRNRLLYLSGLQVDHHAISSLFPNAIASFWGSSTFARRRNLIFARSVRLRGILAHFEIVLSVRFPSDINLQLFNFRLFSRRSWCRLSSKGHQMTREAWPDEIFDAALWPNQIDFILRLLKSKGKFYFNWLRMLVVDWDSVKKVWADGTFFRSNWLWALVNDLIFFTLFLISIHFLDEILVVFQSFVNFLELIL